MYNISSRVVEIFQFWPKWWTNRLTDRPTNQLSDWLKQALSALPLCSSPSRPVSAGAGSSWRGGRDGGESRRAGQLRVWCGLQRCSHAQVGYTAAAQQFPYLKKQMRQKIEHTFMNCGGFWIYSQSSLLCCITIHGFILRPFNNQILNINDTSII